MDQSPIELSSYRLTREGASGLLVMLHGWSAEQHHLAAYVPLVDPGERFTAVCPRAPHDLPEGDGASWYERGPDGPNPAQFLAAVDAVDALISTECEALGIGRDRCVVAGFSQGGFLALAIGARTGAPTHAGIWAMCSAWPVADGLELDPDAASGTPALVQWGTRDDIITPDRTEAAAATLRGAGWSVRTGAYDMGHSQRIEMLVDARDWLADVI